MAEIPNPQFSLFGADAELLRVAIEFNAGDKVAFRPIPFPSPGRNLPKCPDRPDENIAVATGGDEAGSVGRKGDEVNLCAVRGELGFQVMRGPIPHGDLTVGASDRQPLAIARIGETVDRGRLEGEAFLERTPGKRVNEQIAAAISDRDFR